MCVFTVLCVLVEEEALYCGGDGGGGGGGGGGGSGDDIIITIIIIIMPKLLPSTGPACRICFALHPRLPTPLCAITGNDATSAPPKSACISSYDSVKLIDQASANDIVCFNIESLFHFLC